MLRLFFVAAAGLAAAGAQPAHQLDFITGHTDFRESRQMLQKWLRGQAETAFQARSAAVSKLNGAAAVDARKQYLRRQMTDALGGFPERTPLNGRVTATLDYDDYKIEKVIFESQPRFYVTANLYLPKRGQPPYPAILYPLGHEAGAKAHEAWQIMLISLAKKGYVALAWDPLGQGERVQLYDEDFGRSKANASTTEHTMMGMQCLLAGDNVARYTVWDGMRALDYLLSRSEVDAKRVACTGNSGGGTHTAYLSALDDRIQVAAPSCYITSWRRLLETIGPQDAEQCMPPWLAAGLDHPDFIYATGGKPYLMLSAIRDFFSISGARETFREAKRVYDSMGAGDKMDMFEADDGHGYTKPRRTAAYKWFARWLKNSEDTEGEPDVKIAAEQELWCTPTGQVATSLGGETVYTMNRARVKSFASRLHVPTGEEVRRLTGFEKPAGDLRVRPFGVIKRNGYRIEKLVYQSEPGIDIPAVLFVPEGRGGKMPAIIFADGRGKSANAADAEELAAAGNVVLSIDARGLGETRKANLTGAADWSRYFGDYEAAMTAMLLRRTLAGLRAADIVRGVDLLAGRSEVDLARLSGMGREAGAVPMLHAAALDSRIGRVALERGLASYQAVIDRKIHRDIAEQTIPGVLRVYDLPDLAASLKRPVWIVDAADPGGEPLPVAEATRAYARAGNSVRVLRRAPGQGAAALYKDLW